MTVTTRRLALLGALFVVVAAVLFATGLGGELVTRADKGPAAKQPSAELAAIRTPTGAPADYSGLAKIGGFVAATGMIIAVWARVTPRREDDLTSRPTTV